MVYPYMLVEFYNEHETKMAIYCKTIDEVKDVLKNKVEGRGAVYVYELDFIAKG